MPCLVRLVPDFDTTIVVDEAHYTPAETHD
jgi:hypothetical protein